MRPAVMEALPQRGRLDSVSTREGQLLDLDEQVEEVDAVAVAVVSPATEIAPRAKAATIAQAAAVAVTGFAAGAVTAVVVHRNRTRKPAIPARRSQSAGGLVVQSTQRFLVDVHVLAPRD